MELPKSSLRLNFAVTPIASIDTSINEELKKRISEIKACILQTQQMKLKSSSEPATAQRAVFYGSFADLKIQAAAFLASEMGREVYRIDLGNVVSKYMGETEKNLELLFARAQDKNWILFFDEADALFGKRTDVKDAHDRYANLDISYLLQRIDSYDGLIILASNLKKEDDDPLLRRAACVIDFGSDGK